MPKNKPQNRQLELRVFSDEELIVDNFAGGGGASTGIEWALGRSPDIAINHSPEALACHEANHPETRHYCESVWDIDPVKVCDGRPVGLAWFSPDCTHFSRAKGGKPVSKRVRGLAWIVTRWARAVRPRIIILENVEEFETWGPVSRDGRPCPDRRGRTFHAWLSQLRGLGYAVEWRSLVAADYGAPTTRRRLFLIARCDGLPIVWPEKTHGEGRAHSWRPASEIIDWSLGCPSIFERKKPLVDATLRRIATGIRRFILESDSPCIVQGVGHTMVQTGYGERPGQPPRALDLGKPLGTVVAGGSKHALVAAGLIKYYGQGNGQSVTEPLHTVTTKHRFGLFSASLTRAESSRSAAVRRLLEEHGGWSGPEGPVLVEIDGELYAIADVGMRMLRSHELAAAQGFPADYELGPVVNGRPLSETRRIALVGNSVCPHVARALVHAQVNAGERREAA